VVSEYHHAGCPSYTLTITGLCGGGTPTPTPTASPTCTPGGGTPGPWMGVANYPEVLESAAVTSDGTYGYGAGGDFANVPTAGFYRYDPMSNSWTTLAPMPTALFDARSTYASNVNKVYVFGGLDINFNVLNTTYVYDVGLNSWTTGAPMPAGRFFPGVLYYSGNGKIYVIGGVDSSFAEASQTWEYDPVANTWNTSRTSIPVAMGGSATSIVGQFIYLAGSFGSGATTLHYRYDIAGDNWAAMAPLPGPRYEAAGAAVGNHTYVIGGGDPFVGGSLTNSPDTSFNTTFIYDIASDSWSNGPNTNVAHSFTGGTAIGNILMVVAGYDGSSDTNTAETSVVGGDCPSPTPTATATAPTATPTATAPTATPTATAPTATPTATATATATPTSTARPTPTPRAKPTPRPPPTPGPRPTIKPSPWPPPSPTP
jgi:N-acetylneuraminic acid mutarotase